MIKKARSFVFLSLCLSVPSVAFAERSSRRYQKFVEKEQHVCQCQRFSWLNGLQVFVSGSAFFDLFDGEKYVARNVNPNVDALYAAWQNNVVALLGQDEKMEIADLYGEAIDKTGRFLSRGGFDIGVRYMFGWIKSAIGVSATFGFKKYLGVLIKKDTEATMERFLRVKNLSGEKMQTVRDVRMQKEENLEDNDITFRLPEEISVTGLNSDILIEFTHSFFGNLLDTEELQRESFCLLTSFGLGARVNIKTWAKDDVFDEQPEVNKAFLKDRTFVAVPLLKLGMQFLFKQGPFFDVNFLTQLLPTFGSIAAIKEVFVTKGGDFKDKLKAFSSFNMGINIGIGYDFYGLCKGEKLEDYYDN